MPLASLQPTTPSLRLPTHLPRGTRPYARRGVAKIRLGRRLAAGFTPAQAARAEGVEPGDVLALLTEPGFTDLVEACRALESLPEAEQRSQLTSMARFLLRDALALGDLRAALFVLHHEDRGRDPSAVLADGVIAAGRRAAARPADPAPAASAAPLPPVSARPSPFPRDVADLAGRQIANAAVGLRGALLCEYAAVTRATAPEDPQVVQAVEAPAPVEAAPSPAADATAATAPVAKAAAPARPTAPAARKPSLDALASRIGRAAAIRLLATPGSPGVGRLPRRPRAP